MSGEIRPGSILATGQGLIRDAMAQLPPGKRRALVVLVDGDQTIAAEWVERVGDHVEFSAGFRKMYQESLTARVVVRASW